MAKRRLLSVYPGPFAESILGFSSQSFNKGLQAFASLLAAATKENESRFTPGEWQLLYDATHKFDFVPGAVAGGMRPSLAMAELLTRSAWQSEPANTKEFRQRVSALDYVHGWAVVFAVMYAERSVEHPNKVEWWKLKERCL